jgi:hypothetical protein
MDFRPYDGEQARELVNSEQIYDALVAAESELEQRFRGSMSWKRVAGREYLYRKRTGGWRSLGPRGEETQREFEVFMAGRTELKERIAALDARLRRSARVNRALGLGRVPFLAARIVRRLADEKLLGTNLLIVGTPALYAYERMAGGQLHPSLVATADLDLLLDARQGIRVVADRYAEGLIGILRAVDKSFALLGPRAFRAANDQGYMVDLITPIPANAAGAHDARIGSITGDLEPAEIDGLQWLQNSPRVAHTVIDEKGFPLRMVVPDPRSFVVHKLWVSSQSSRDRTKARRDREQALAVAALLNEHLPHMQFDSRSLGAFPASVREMAAEVKKAKPPTDELPPWR